jgi:seryl-tRNA synthetase
MNDLLKTTEDLEITADLLMVATTLSEWKKRKPTDEIIELTQAFSRIVFYVSHLQFERNSYDIAISNVKKVKNEEIMKWRERAEVAEKALSSNPLNL